MAIDLDNITSGYQISKINANFQKVEDYVNDKLLARAVTGVAGEAMMERDLDMDGHRILNADIDGSTITNDRAVRVPAGEGSIPALPDANTRKGKILTFDINTGLPIVTAPVGGSAVDVLNQLALPSGATLVNTSTGVRVETRLQTLDTTVASHQTAVDFVNGGLYSQYTRAAEIAKIFKDGGSVAIDCFGDSTMWGATALNTGVQNIYNPPAVLRTTITNLYGVSPTVTNRGISGTTMAQMLAGTDGSGQTFEQRVSTTPATLIYCNHCINDSQLDNNIHQYRLNCIEFVRLCRKYNKVPILVTPNINPAAPVAAIITEVKSKRLETYVEVMREVAKVLSTDLVDNYYYYEKTTALVSPLTLVPDGAHPDTEAYKMSGRNMAIPLVSAHTLYEAWDKAPLGNSTYFDNITTSRQYQSTGTPFNRFNGNLSGVRTGSNTGLNMAVILDNPTVDTVLATYGLSWSSGTISIMYENGSSLETSYGGYVNQGNSITPIDWDALHIPERCQLYAGLHVPGWLSNTSIAGALGEGFGFSGVGLVPREMVGTGRVTNTEIRNLDMVSANSELTFMLPLFSPGTQFTLKGASNNSAIINLEWAGTGTPLNVTTSLGNTYQVAASVSPAVYRARMKFNSDKTITVTVGASSVTVPAPASAWPNMYVGSLGQPYTIKYVG